MSEQYPGGWLTKTPPTPSGPYYNSTAPGIWTLTQQAQLTLQGIWPTAGNNPPIYWIMTIAPPVVGGYTTIATNTNKYKVDSSGNMYPSFNTNPASGPYYALWNISKIDINGNLIFTKSYSWDGTNNGTLFNSTALSSNDLIVHGYTASTPYYGFYGKFNSSGVAQWNFQLTTSDNNIQNFAGTDSSNNLYFVGQAVTGAGVWIKTNSSGAIQASNQINSARTYLYMNYGSVDTNGIYTGSGTTLYEAYIIRFQANGTVLYLTTLGTGYGGFFASAVVDPTFLYIYTLATFPSNYYFNLWKVDASNGTTVAWSKYSNDLQYYSQMLDCDSSGNLYVFCTPVSPAGGSAILKFNSSGTLQWQRSLYYTGSTVTVNNITIDNTNSVFILSMILNTSPNRAVIVRLPIDGSQTGTYGAWVYAASSYTINNTATGTWSSSSPTGSGSFTSATSTPTIAATTFTSATSKIA